MNRLIIALAALVAATPAIADTYVNGYTRKNGTYVAPHYRSNSDSNRYNNYSSQGMVNPYTGRSGTVSPYNPPSYNYGNTYTNPYRQR